jgi:hypothetical protein
LDARTKDFGEKAVEAEKKQFKNGPGARCGAEGSFFLIIFQLWLVVLATGLVRWQI